MPSLNPQTQFSVAAEAPVEDRSAGAIFDLVGMGLDAVARAPKVDSGDNPALNAEVIRGMKRIRAARREGKMDLARRLELNLQTEYSKAGGDPNSGWFQQNARTITGREPDSWTFTDEEIALQQLKESPEYQGAVAATLITHPSASPEDREQLALGSIAAKEGRTAIIAQADFNFTTETAGAINANIDDYVSTVFGNVAANGQQGNIVTLEQADLAVNAWNREKAKLTRPATVSAEAWAPVQERIDAVDKVFTDFRDMVKPGNVSAQALSNIYTAVKAADFPNEDMLLVSLSADPDMLMTMGILPVDETISAMKSLRGKGLVGTELRDPNASDPLIVDTSNETRSPDELFTVAWDSLKTANAHGNTVVNNADVRENWAGIVSRGMDHLAYVTAQGEFVSEDALNGMFNDNFFKKIKQVSQQDPELGAALMARSTRALTQAGLAAEAQYKVLRERSAFNYDVRTGQFTANRASVRRALAGETGSQAFGDVLVEAVDEVYGGDYEALIADRGNALIGLTNEGGPDAYDLWNRITDNGRVSQPMMTAANSMYSIGNSLKKLNQQTISDLDPGNSIDPSEIRVPAEVMKDVEFLTAVTNTSAALNLDPTHLMKAISFETNGSFRPDIQPVRSDGTLISSATGLIQFLESTARDYGTSTQELKGMTRAEQMQYVEAYLTDKLQGVQNPGFDHIYMAIHYPAGLNKDDSWALYRANGDKRSRDAYNANKSLDSNGDGTVTRGEAWRNAWARSGGASMPAGFSQSNLTPPGATSGPESENPAQVFTSPRPQSRPGAVTPEGEATAGTVETSRAASQLSSNTQRLLAQMNMKADDLPAFTTMAEVDQAADAGNLKKGDMFLVNGQLVKFDG